MKTVYLATPKERYADPSYPVVLSALRQRFPSSECELIEPAKADWTNKEWSDAWETLQPTIDSLVLWPRPDGSVGAGCYQEVMDTQRSGKPVLCIRSDGDFCEFAGLDVLTPAIDLLGLIPGLNLRAVINRWVSRCARVKGWSDG